MRKEGSPGYQHPPHPSSCKLVRCSRHLLAKEPGSIEHEPNLGLTQQNPGASRYTNLTKQEELGTAVDCSHPCPHFVFGALNAL